MYASCTACQTLWEEYARLAEVRLRLNREQQVGGASHIAGLRIPLGQRIQMLAAAQIGVRKRLSAHELERHRPRIAEENGASPDAEAANPTSLPPTISLAC